jgi:hypothetical protein
MSVFPSCLLISSKLLGLLRTFLKEILFKIRALLICFKVHNRIILFIVRMIVVLFININIGLNI